MIGEMTVIAAVDVALQIGRGHVEQAGRHVQGALLQLRRLVGLGDGVQVHDAEQALVAVLERDPVLHRAEVVADVQLARGLDAAEDARHRSAS